MLYANVVLGLPVEGPFDYIVPAGLEKKIEAGKRAWVPFGTRRLPGFVVGLSKKTAIANLKEVLDVIDGFPVLNKKMLSLTKKISDYYCCSWGEAVQAALPRKLKNGASIKMADSGESRKNAGRFNDKGNVLIQDLDGLKRWEMYKDEVRDALKNNKSAIILLPDINSIQRAKEILKSEFASALAILYRNEPEEFREWLKIKEGKASIVIGTRSGIFAPLDNLGLIIIDGEESGLYKQDQMPHYNAREVAFMRGRIEKAKVILGTSAPSLESFYLAEKNKIRYIPIPKEKTFPEIKIIAQGRVILSKYLEDSIVSCLNSGGKTLLFLNRRGFATFASCRNCHIVLKCPRCSINLVYHFKQNILNCHYCNFRMPPPKICPTCNASYIRYSGTGTEKVESELSRILPQARIKMLDDADYANKDEADIFIATKSIMKEPNYKFGLVGVLSIDNSLNRVDFRAPEKTFALLTGLLRLTGEKMIIQTNLPQHHCFIALQNQDQKIFYAQELRQRKQLIFPPYSHIGLVKLRCVKEIKAKEAANALFEKLNKTKRDKSIKIISVSPAHPQKLRGKFYWQILIKAASPLKIARFLKTHLKYFSHSGIIMTVDIDPL